MRARLKRWKEDFLGAVEQVERASLLSRGEGDLRRLDLQVFGVIILASLVLSFQEYYGSSNGYKIFETPLSWFVDDAPGMLRSYFARGERAKLHRLFYWAGATARCYFVLPALWIKLVMRQRLRDFGFSLQGTARHAWIYITMYLLVLPALFVVGDTKSFQRQYPFYQQAHKSAYDFLAWEFAYAMQFLSLEFFFRGFLIHGLKHRFGYYCILISVIPYCMIHFGKPLPETIGAIFAGLALGTLSLFTRSIWLGVAIHVSVAVSMDIISLWYQGKIFA